MLRLGVSCRVTVRLQTGRYTQGGHEPGKPGKPGILREFEKPQGIQGKLREFQCYSGNFVRMRNLRTFCRIFSFFKFTRVKTWLPVHLFWK